MSLGIEGLLKGAVKFFGRTETKPVLPLTGAEKKEIWNLSVEPRSDVIVEPAYAEKLGIVCGPGTPMYREKVAAQTDELLKSYPKTGFNLLEKREIDLVTRKIIPGGNIVLVVVPKEPAPMP